MSWLIILGICAGAIWVYRSGRIGPTTRIECPICKEAIRPDALAYPHCQTDLLRGPVGRSMRTQRAELVRQHRGQQAGDWILLATLTTVIFGVILYIWLQGW